MTGLGRVGRLVLIGLPFCWLALLFLLLAELLLLLFGVAFLLLGVVTLLFLFAILLAGFFRSLRGAIFRWRLFRFLLLRGLLRGPRFVFFFVGVLTIRRTAR